VVAQQHLPHNSGKAGSTGGNEVYASGEAALASFDCAWSSTERGVPQSLRMRAFRMDPEAALLGPAARDAGVVGDVDMLGGNLTRREGVGRGCSSATRPIERPTRSGTNDRRSGALPLGWDAELYRNGQLLGYQSDGLDARYEFDSPSWSTATTTSKVVPMARKARFATRPSRFRSARNAVVAGRLEYWAGIIERNRDLITFSQPFVRPRYERRLAIRRRGAVTGSMTAKSSSGQTALSHVYIRASGATIAELNLQRALGRMLFNLTASQEFGRGRAYRLDILGDIGPIGIQTESFFVDGGYTSTLIARTRAARIACNFIRRSGPDALPSVSAGFRRTTHATAGR
jgi:hypothetical protein